MIGRAIGRPPPVKALGLPFSFFELGAFKLHICYSKKPYTCHIQTVLIVWHNASRVSKMNSRHSVSLEKKMTFRLTEEEFQRLESYCNQVKRSKTEILRELIRSLPESKSESQAEQ